MTSQRTTVGFSGRKGSQVKTFLVYEDFTERRETDFHLKTSVKSILHNMGSLKLKYSNPQIVQQVYKRTFSENNKKNSSSALLFSNYLL